MQVRMNGYGADIQRHWGKRNSTLQDFLYDQNVFLGQSRIGPDLADVGTRLPDRQTELLHLYNPRITTPGSLMPQFAYLFQKEKIQGPPNPKALHLPAQFAPESGYQVIQTHEAEALVSYLQSLHAQQPILEAPIYPPPPKTNAVKTAAAGTNTSSAPVTTPK
jgi:cytochrome c oxidase cbb3-type subunit 2